ncbi:PREDICTED: uncharacterized protein LOC107191891 [Dufourea novaeangliae]|uniref:uncharacterized protein LOC107191891 n=1 Tax=Dufourea novaeangliae TaxID=178035 RepID=UPI000766F926|nr:PREDICTED: uncharacterized protein LOC107191891 [Dufourea novaeangliae]
MVTISQRRRRHPRWRMLFTVVIFAGLVRHCELTSAKRLTDIGSFSSSSTLSRGSAETRSQDVGSPNDLAWQAWLLVDSQSGSHSGLDSASFLRRITPKSVFIAPALPALPPCADGYRADTMGRCVKNVNIDQEAHIVFLLEQLNSRYRPRGDSSNNNHKKSNGPLQLNIPLLGNTNSQSSKLDHEDTRDSIKIPVVIPPRENSRDPIKIPVVIPPREDIRDTINIPVVIPPRENTRDSIKIPVVIPPREITRDSIKIPMLIPPREITRDSIKIPMVIPPREDTRDSIKIPVVIPSYEDTRDSIEIPVVIPPYEDTKDSIEIPVVTTPRGDIRDSTEIPVVIPPREDIRNSIKIPVVIPSREDIRDSIKIPVVIPPREDTRDSIKIPVVIPSYEDTRDSIEIPVVIPPREDTNLKVEEQPFESIIAATDPPKNSTKSNDDETKDEIISTSADLDAFSSNEDDEDILSRYDEVVPVAEFPVDDSNETNFSEVVDYKIPIDLKTLLNISNLKAINITDDAAVWKNDSQFLNSTEATPMLILLPSTSTNSVVVPSVEDLQTDNETSYRTSVRQDNVTGNVTDTETIGEIVPETTLPNQVLDVPQIVVDKIERNDTQNGNSSEVRNSSVHGSQAQVAMGNRVACAGLSREPA